MNISWNPAVYDHWEDEGCMDEVRERLGYRYRVEVARTASPVPGDGALRLQLRVANEGFATVINERPVEVVLRDADTGEEHRVATDADPRLWRSGHTTNEVLRVAVPDGVEAGEYDLLLNLPDAAESLREDPRFSLRLANEGAWEAETGLNDLGLRVRVGD